MSRIVRGLTWCLALMLVAVACGDSADGTQVSVASCEGVGTQAGVPQRDGINNPYDVVLDRLHVVHQASVTDLRNAELADR